MSIDYKHRILSKAGVEEQGKHDKEHLTVIKELEKLKQAVVDHAISDTNNPEVKEEAKELAKSNYKLKILKKSQWSYEGKLDSVQDALEGREFDIEPQKHIGDGMTTVTLEDGNSYKLGKKLGDEGDVDYYESWWTSPDLPKGKVLHYVEGHEKKLAYWEIEDSVI